MAAESIASRIKPLGKPTEVKPTMNIYGEPGVGKTTFVSYAPKLLLISAEGGETSIHKTPNKPDIIEASSLKDLGEIYLWLKAGDHPYESVAIDTLTEVQKIALVDIVREESTKKPNKDPDIPTIPDYGLLGKRMSKAVRAFRDLPMNVFFLCHTRVDKDEDTGVVSSGPNLTPAVATDVNAYVDAIFYIGMGKEGQRQILTQPHRRFVAKHRLGELPNVIEFSEDVMVRADVVMDMMVGKVEPTAKVDKEWLKANKYK